MTKLLYLFLFLASAVNVFGQSPAFMERPYEAAFPFYDGKANLGDVLAMVQGQNVIWIDRYTLVRALKNHLQEDTLKAVELLSPRLTPAQLPFPFRFNPEELKFETTLPLEKLARKETDLRQFDHSDHKYALTPAPFGGAINYRLEQNWGDEQLGGNFFSGQFNSFINMNSLVLENQTFYQSNIDSNWYRGDTRLVKDFEKYAIRAQAGDIYPEVQGFMVGRPIGGIGVQRNFSLNPYRLPYPTGHQNFTLRSRSLVKYYVNSVLVKSEHLNPGNYSASDIPLNNGLNNVVVEATDELGVKQVFVFRSSTNINLLNEGESRFDLSYGVPFLDTNFKRDYRDEDGKLFSGFYQYGFSSVFSGSAYLQNQNEFNLYGSELIHSTPIGNLTLGHARSHLEQSEGYAGSLGYQLITQGKRWYDSHTLLLRYELRSETFRSTTTDSASIAQNIYSASYTIPVSNILTFSLGGNYGDVRDNDLSDRYGIDTNFSFRLFNHHNLSLYLSRNRDEYKNWNDTAYVFLTFSIPESNHYVSGLYDHEQKNVRVNVLKDNQNRLYAPRTQAVANYGEENKNAEFDLTYPTPVGDLGGRIYGNQSDNNQNSGRGSIRLNSAIVFAAQNDAFGMGVARPIPGSFVIFKPEERLQDQKIALKSTSPYTESETGLFDEIVFSNLIAYQYRDIQLDPTYLDMGTTLKKEKFVVYPTYRSAHLIKLHERGSVILTGKLVNEDGSPLTLQVGSIGGQPFFTNRNGEIFIEGLEPGRYEMTIDGRDQRLRFVIEKEDRGLKDIGIIEIKENEL